MQIFYSDTFELPLPASHRFPMDKYRLLREHLQRCEDLAAFDFQVAEAATDEQLLLVHLPKYLEKLKLGTLTEIEQRRIGFPWSEQMVERARRSTRATIAAARAALDFGVGVHLAGGTHHAFPDHGQGFCVFNDVAVAIRVLQAERRISRAVVIDLDVHQGNGTAAIFAADHDVFTFSMHGERNFPFAKCNGDLDISLADGTTDDSYLTSLRDALDNRLPMSDADIVFYLAGADPYEHDRYGKLKLTHAGLKTRDELVIAACREHDCQMAVVMAGGYALDVDDVVSINATTIRSLLTMDS